MYIYTTRTLPLPCSIASFILDRFDGACQSSCANVDRETQLLVVVVDDDAPDNSRELELTFIKRT